MCPDGFSLVRVGEDEVDSFKPSSTNVGDAAARSCVDGFTPQFFKVLIERTRGFEEDEDAAQRVFQDAIRDLYFQEPISLLHNQVVDLKGLTVAAKLLPVVLFKFGGRDERWCLEQIHTEASGMCKVIQVSHGLEEDDACWLH